MLSIPFGLNHNSACICVRFCNEHAVLFAEGTVSQYEEEGNFILQWSFPCQSFVDHGHSGGCTDKKAFSLCLYIGFVSCCGHKVVIFAVALLRVSFGRRTVIISNGC